jgi:hypothetical protein
MPGGLSRPLCLKLVAVTEDIPLVLNTHTHTHTHTNTQTHKHTQAHNIQS